MPSAMSDSGSYDGLCSPEEALLLSALTSELADDQAAAGEEGAHLFKASRLLRFLQGSEGSTEAAAAQFRAMLTFREANDVASLRSQVVGKPWAPESAPCVQKLCQVAAVSMWTFTQDGDILSVHCDGRASLDKINEMTDEEIFTMDNTMMELRQEHLDKISEESGKLAKVVQVRDLSALGLVMIISNALMISRIQQIMKNSLSCYPETLRRVLLLDAPTGFATLWALLSPLLNERVQSKIRFLSIADICEIVDLAGASCIEELAGLRGPRGIEDSLEIAAGGTAYGWTRVEEGSRLEWRFVVKDMDISFHLWFFSFEAHVTPKEVQSAERLCGAVTGDFEAECGGLLWATWSNQYSWMNGKSIEEISGFTLW